MRVRTKFFGGVLAVVLATALSAAGTAAADTARSAPAPAVSAAGLQTATVVAAATPLVFDVNGTYTDGGSARPVLSDANDILTVDMSSQGRPTANGVVINSDTILVTFPDAGTFTAKLQAPGTIRWSNGSAWQKLTVVVPNVLDDKEPVARAILVAAGLVVGPEDSVVDRTCDHNKTVSIQSPAAGTLVLPGTVVFLTIGLLPPPGQCF